MELRRLFGIYLAPPLASPRRRPLGEPAGIARTREIFDRAAVAIVFIAAISALLATAPVNGDFWWSDAPRHALNGVFIKDFVAASPWRDPKGWAINYYLQYPALTILFYPPLFYCFEAITFAVMGVSQLAAQVTVTLFTIILGAAAYAFVRLDFPRWSALGAALLVIGGPEIAFWGRQIMLDVPAYAAVVTGVYCYARYVRTEQPKYLYFALIAILTAVYIKLTAAFIAPVLAAHLVASRGTRVLRDRHALLVAILGIVGLIPAAVMTVKFGSANVQSVAGRSSDLPRTSLAAWLFYAEAIPRYLGYLGTALGVCGLGLVLRRRIAPLDARMAWLLLGWLVFGYLFFSGIEVRESRHGLMLAFPLVVFAVLALHRLLPRGLAPAATTVLGIGTLVYALVFYPPPRIEGYAQVADYVARTAPKNSVVLFSGYRDGNFVFDLRTHEDRRDLSTLRADKLLLRIAVERIRGVGQTDLDQQKIAAALREYGVGLVVAQPDFWTDLREMARLDAVLHGKDFEPIARFPIIGTTAHTDHAIVIYRPTYEVEPARRKLRLDMPIIGQHFEGEVGAQPLRHSGNAANH